MPFEKVLSSIKTSVSVPHSPYLRCLRACASVASLLPHDELSFCLVCLGWCQHCAAARLRLPRTECERCVGRLPGAPDRASWAPAVAPSTTPALRYQRQVVGPGATGQMRHHCTCVCLFAHNFLESARLGAYRKRRALSPTSMRSYPGTSKCF